MTAWDWWMTVVLCLLACFAGAAIGLALVDPIWRLGVWLRSVLR